MGASSSGLSGSEWKKAGGDRDIQQETVPLAPQQDDTTDVALREIAAERIRSAYPDCESGEVDRLAASLSDCSNLLSTYFSNMEQQESLPVSIIWREIASLEIRRDLAEAFDKFASQFDYGPYCAMIQVGNVYLMWDNTDLVIPQSEISPIFEENITDLSTGSQNPSHDEGACVDVSKRAATLSPDDIVIPTIFKNDFVVEMTPYKIDALMQTLVRYNTKFNYGLLSCNCQHFVADILEALDAKPLARRYKDCLEHHTAVLEYRGLNVLKEEFNTHRELDTYVNVQLEYMSVGEMYFCLGHYLLFHAWCKECSHLQAFKCCSGTCRSREITRRIL